MRKWQAGLIIALLAAPALAKGGAEPLLVAVLVYLIYMIVSSCLVGWSLLVLAVGRRRVETTSKTLQDRPLASFVMGLLCLGWLLLSLGLAKPLGGLGGLLVLFTLSALVICALVGLPAILFGLGRRLAPLWGRPVSVIQEMLMGGFVLMAAGGFPWLGQLMLVGMLIWSCGGSVLSMFAGDDGKTKNLPKDEEEVDLNTR